MDLSLVPDPLVIRRGVGRKVDATQGSESCPASRFSYQNELNRNGNVADRDADGGIEGPDSSNDRDRPCATSILADEYISACVSVPSFDDLFADVIASYASISPALHLDDSKESTANTVVSEEIPYYTLRPQVDLDLQADDPSFLKPLSGGKCTSERFGSSVYSTEDAKTASKADRSLFEERVEWYRFFFKGTPLNRCLDTADEEGFSDRLFERLLEETRYGPSYRGELKIRAFWDNVRAQLRDDDRTEEECDEFGQKGDLDENKILRDHGDDGLGYRECSTSFRFGWYGQSLAQEC
ncbi:MAG: hypothetical protein M1818_004090 [Claussenomyces sp. TS43310]|nr:MAG: hypothetical protein M1818_004090 [Claussenomyces sp. TS43310]